VGFQRRAASSGGVLAGGGYGAAEHLRDLGEAHVEHVVQHERDPLFRGQSFQHDHGGHPDVLVAHDKG